MDSSIGVIIALLHWFGSLPVSLEGAFPMALPSLAFTLGPFFHILFHFPLCCLRLVLLRLVNPQTAQQEANSSCSWAT
jgi:hypothetical protein